MPGGRRAGGTAARTGGAAVRREPTKLAPPE
jgi:hypothetical protein